MLLMMMESSCLVTSLVFQPLIDHAQMQSICGDAGSCWLTNFQTPYGAMVKILGRISVYVSRAVALGI